jgi:signal transduction histidine kinase
VLLAVGPIALAWRRRFPVAVLAVVFATTLAYWTAGFARGPAFFALIVAFGTVVLAGHRRVAWACLALGFVTFLWLGPLAGSEAAPGLAEVLGLAAWLLVLGAAAESLRFRRERTVTAARAAEEERRARAGEERLRIARELHDVVAHNLSLINVQAGAALHVLGEHPEAAAGALAAIKDASKAGLDELRSLLDVLRAGSDADAAPRVPTPTLADLDALVDRTSAAGVPVELRIDGLPRPLARSVETAAYRVAQEALTNVVRHAGPAHTVVHVSYGPAGFCERCAVESDGASF